MTATQQGPGALMHVIARALRTTAHTYSTRSLPSVSKDLMLSPSTATKLQMVGSLHNDAQVLLSAFDSVQHT